MYSVAMSPPRGGCRVPREDRGRGSEHGSRYCRDECPAWRRWPQGKLQPKRDSGRGFTGLSCAAPLCVEITAIGNRTAASTAMVRMFTQGPRSFSYKGYFRIVNGKHLGGRYASEHRTGATLAVFSFPVLWFCPATAVLIFRALAKSCMSPSGWKSAGSGVPFAAANLRLMSSSSCLTQLTLAIWIWPSCPIKNRVGTFVRP